MKNPIINLHLHVNPCIPQCKIIGNCVLPELQEDINFYICILENPEIIGREPGILITDPGTSRIVPGERKIKNIQTL